MSKLYLCNFLNNNFNIGLCNNVETILGHSIFCLYPHERSPWLKKNPWIYLWNLLVLKNKIPEITCTYGSSPLSKEKIHGNTLWMISLLRIKAGIQGSLKIQTLPYNLPGNSRQTGGTDKKYNGPFVPFYS